MDVWTPMFPHLNTSLWLGSLLPSYLLSSLPAFLPLSIFSHPLFSSFRSLRISSNEAEALGTIDNRKSPVLSQQAHVFCFSSANRKSDFPNPYCLHNFTKLLPIGHKLQAGLLVSVASGVWRLRQEDYKSPRQISKAHSSETKPKSHNLDNLQMVSNVQFYRLRIRYQMSTDLLYGVMQISC